MGLPVNKTAAQAGVAALVARPGWGETGWALTLVLPGRAERTLTLADLAALPSHTATLPIACAAELRRAPRHPARHPGQRGDPRPRPRLPARIIAPTRPGVLQTKWVSRVEVLP